MWSRQWIGASNSGHGMIWEEAEKYHDILINTIVPETYHP